MRRSREPRNHKVYERSRRHQPYVPKPPRSDVNALWNRIESLVAEEAGESTPASSSVEEKPTKRKRGAARRAVRRKRVIRVLDTIGALIWIAAVVKLFVGDLDRMLVASFVPELTWILDMRWLVVLLVVALVLILFRARSLGIAFAYVAFFPVVVLAWKIPKLLVKRRSALLLSTLAGLATGFMARARFFIIAIAIASLSGSLITTGESDVIVGIGMVAMLATLLWWLTVTSIDLLHSSAFIRAQERAIEWLFSFHAVEMAVTPEQPDQLELKRWTVGDAKKFRDTAGNAILARRALLFWAGAVGQYRRGPAAILLNGALVLFLLVLVVISFAFINYGVWAIDPSQFKYEAAPEAWTFVYYSITAISFSEISALSPVSGLAVAVKLANGVIGGVGVISIIGSNLLGVRAARADSPSAPASYLREKARELENLSTLQFQMSLEDLQARLLATGWSLLGVVNWLTQRTPADPTRTNVEA